ncbi:arginine/serine-rich protein PNISR isoform X2 [Dendroctonus ponderosae]|uniref:Arginine/serine-rich protein PNISR n=1 Tax=Dendroctonus ponderosae TaxID=77166 RepID=A0AAR5NYR9_DENPD|nr:arginine/serine-rich protein PNISR isoform X2 [Dendroctonus ponderosae]
MFSGGDSTGSPKCTQWAMNPAAYQNTANDEVDWAALAQQWIIMKEAGPPPIPGGPELDKGKTRSGGPLPPEGGEAEMEMDNEREEPPAWNPAGSDNPPPAPGSDSWATWNQPPSQGWNWTSSWSSPTAVPPPIVVKTPLLPTPNRMFPTSDAGSDNAVPYGGYNSNSQSSNNDFSHPPAFWTNMAVSKITQTEIKPHNKRYSKVNVPTKVTIITPAGAVEPHLPPPAVVAEEPVVPAPSVPVLDANRRKQLPAWIREGLEKMERDKLKQMEKEKEKLARDDYTEKVKLEEKEAMEILKSTIQEKNLLKKSRFESDHEQSDDEPPKRTVRKVSPPPPVPLSQDELMMKVRKTMTEILLKVTNQLIEQACKEERQRYIKKRRASDELASAPSGAAIKAKLGLGVYADDSTSSEDSGSEDRRDESSDSESELKESIKKRQAAFSKTEQEIKERLADVERKKESKPKSPSHSSRSSSADAREIDSQVEPNTQGNAKEEEIPSSNKAKPKRRSSSSSRASSRSRSPARGRKTSRYSPKKRSRSLSTVKSSRRGRSKESYRRDSIDSKKRGRRSRSGSRYSKRSKRSRSRSRSYSKMGRRLRRTKSRSRSRDRPHRSHKSTLSRSHDARKRSRRSRSRSCKKSPSRSKRRSSRSSSRGRRSHRR